MKFNFLSLHDKIRTRNDALKFAQERNLIKSSAKCKSCSQLFTVQHTQAQTNYVFFTCTQCHTKESIRKDTFLYNKVCWNFRTFMYEPYHLVCISISQNISIKSFLLLALIFTQMPNMTIPQITHQVDHWSLSLHVFLPMFFSSQHFSWTWLSLSLKTAMCISLKAMDCQTPL